MGPGRRPSDPRPGRHGLDPGETGAPPHRPGMTGMRRPPGPLGFRREEGHHGVPAFRASHQRGAQMFGPLPMLHRIVLGAISLCFGIVAGIWIAHATSLPVAISGGALSGGLLGLLAAYVLLHAHPEPRPVRVTRRR